MVVENSTFLAICFRYVLLLLYQKKQIGFVLFFVKIYITTTKTLSIKERYLAGEVIYAIGGIETESCIYKNNI